MTMNDKPLTRNYDSDKEKSEIDSDIRILKIRQRLTAHSIIPAEEVASTVCHLTFFCHLYQVTHYAFMVTRSTFMDHLLNNNLRRSPHFGNDPLKTSK